ncbi:MAG: hypothetical protein PGN09_07665 [Sphingomonas fennica]
MGSALTVVEAVLFETLEAGITDAPVLQDVPEDQPLPVVIVGDLLSVPFGGKDDPDRRITATIITLCMAEERAPLLALQEQIETLLDEQRFERDGWTLAMSVDSAEAVLGEDGITYVGTSTFTILALRD